MPDAGWYRDPQDPSAEEYWDGQAWSGARRPATGYYAQQAGTVAAGPQTWGQRPGPQQPFGQVPGASGYGAPGYGAPGYGAPAYAAPTSGTFAYGAPAPPAAPKRRRGALLVAAAIVVALVAAGIVTVALRSGSSPRITYDGKQIASPDAPLRTAEKAVDALVSRDHGAKRSDTRCYYAQPTKPASGAKASDVADSLRCGPVLFVDGDPAEEYLAVPLDADTAGKQVALTPETSTLDPASESAIGKGLTLVRPDGASAPSGNGGLSVPQPPPAGKDSIIATTLSAAEAPDSDLDAGMISKNRGVTLLGAGYIPRYGTGAAARSAPDGQRLIAFRIATGVGALGPGGPRPTLVVGGSSRAIPAAAEGDWDVAAVPTGSDPVIQLDADGYRQTLSLPGGKAGSGNIAVLTRSSSSGYIGSTFSMHSTLSKNGASETDKIAVTINGANLYFWPPVHPKHHPKNPGSAFLSIAVTYKNPSEPGKVIGYDPGLLRLDLPGSHSERPRNLAGPGHIYDVFTVPAGFTKGTLVIGGSAAIGHGIHQHLKETKRVAVDIPR